MSKRTKTGGMWAIVGACAAAVIAAAAVVTLTAKAQGDIFEERRYTTARLDTIEQKLDALIAAQADIGKGRVTQSEVDAAMMALILKILADIEKSEEAASD